MSIDTLLTEIPGITLQRGVPLKNFTTWRIGGPAQWFVVATTVDGLVEAIAACRTTGTSFVILGGGSNVLFPDAGYDGVVIRVTAHAMTFSGATVRAEAGVVYAALAQQAAKRGLRGLEFAATIPGTVGGAIRGNAGAWDGETKDWLATAEVLRADGSRGVRAGAECQFGYRESVFKHNDEIVLAGTFALQQGSSEEALEKIRGFQKTKRERQPLDAPAAGSTFKNVPVAQIAPELYARYQMESIRKGDVVPVGYLIERAGLKGFTIGGIRVSEKHANFLLNDGTATAEQVVELISVIKQKIRSTFQGLQIELEVQLIGL
jgi:UDP-N-acetylmuramate dehydrogenase